MENDVKTAEASAETLVPKAERPRPLARVQAVPWLIVILLLAASAWLAWRAFGPSDLGNPLATSLVAFEEQNELTVFSAQLAPVVSSTDSRFFGAIESRQVAVIPARVDYRVALGEVDASRLDWNEAEEMLTVRLPALEVGRPNLDEAQAQYLREGIWISRDAQDKLTRENTRTAERMAQQQAGNPVLMRMARDAARRAVAQNLAIPLEVAGYGDVEVEVLFDGENAAP